MGSGGHVSMHGAPRTQTHIHRRTHTHTHGRCARAGRGRCSRGGAAAGAYAELLWLHTEVADDVRGAPRAAKDEVERILLWLLIRGLAVVAAAAVATVRLCVVAGALPSARPILESPRLCAAAQEPLRVQPFSLRRLLRFLLAKVKQLQPSVHVGTNRR